MSLFALGLNLLVFYLALQKRMIVYALLTAYFLFLVIGQSLQIDADLGEMSSVSYLYAFITRSGFSQAEVFVVGSSLISLLLVIIAPGFTHNDAATPKESFAPPPLFYALLLFLLVTLSGALIFVVVGLSVFLNASRPGFESGSTVILTLLAAGLYPLLLKQMYRGRPHAGDWSCAAVTLLVSMGFSRMHVITYLTSLCVTYYYNSRWSAKAIRIKHLLVGSVGACAAMLFFITLGAVRDAQNFGGGSVATLIRYNLDHPDENMLSLAVTYRRSVEGMSALAGAFSAAEAHPAAVKHDYGIRWAVGGVMLAMPGQMKTKLKSFDDALLSLFWYDDPIIASGISQFYQSFGWMGMLLYPAAFFCLAWYSILAALRANLAPALRLCFYLMTGFGIFFVRGTLQGWIGYSLAYCATIIVTAPLWTMWIVREAGPVSAGDFVKGSRLYPQRSATFMD